MKMEKNKFNILLTFLMVSLILGISSCKKDGDVNLQSIALNKTTTTIGINQTETLSALFTPSDASFKDITWSTSDASVASVADGIVKGLKIGNATITATSTIDSKIIASCVVTVDYSQVVIKTGDITANETWTADKKYKLNGFVYVKNATLTIEPGTVITGVVDSKGTLIVERGAKIMAVGTAQKPIVFTSDKAPGTRHAGDWGGLVLCGKALTNKSDGGSAGVGIAEGGIGSLYGGTDDADNSGVLQYVRIEFPGIALLTNSEINGLTLYAVGSGTTIDHIQVSWSGDDSFEWFGGSVNCKYLVANSGLDDDFDTDNGFRGTVQFIVGMREATTADQSKSNGFESDNDATGSLTAPFTAPIFCNVTLFGPMGTSPNAYNILYQSAMHIRRSSRLSVYNSVFIGWPDGLRLDGGLGDSPAQADANVLQIENCVLAGMGLKTNSDADNYANVSPHYLTAESKAYFLENTSPVRNNSTVAGIIYSSTINLANPAFTPAPASLLTGASFTNARLSSNTFLDKTPTYKGAFGTTDWTAGWCNFNPQITAY
jgi:hypothetical protein